MITLKQLKDKLHKDFGWKNLESNDNKWFVDNLLKDTIQAINYTHSCMNCCTLCCTELKDKEIPTFKEWKKDTYLHWEKNLYVRKQEGLKDVEDLKKIYKKKHCL